MHERAGLHRVVAVVLVVAATLASGAFAAPSARAAAVPAGTVQTFTDPSMGRPIGIASGPDGALWFTEDIQSTIGRITTNGSVTTFTDPQLNGPTRIIAGADGAMWFNGLSANGGASVIGRVTMAGAFSFFPVPTGFVIDLAAGPDGAIWFTDVESSMSRIGRLGPSGTFTFFADPALSLARGISTGPDGALWFTQLGTDKPIGRVTTSGSFTFYAAAVVGDSIVSGPDGALWFTGRIGTDPHLALGRITTAGVASSFTDATMGTDLTPAPIVAGADGAMWFRNGSSLGRATMAGSLSALPLPDGDVSSMTSGPDGALWNAVLNPGAPDGSISRVTVIGVPSAPQRVAATTGATSAKVAWTASGADGGAPITSYVVTASPGGATCTWTSGPLSCTVTGLGTGVASTFTVTAFTATGPSPTSAPSTPVRPMLASTFHALAPVRILDSRPGPGNVGWTGALQDATARSLPVTGTSGVPADATAVVMNVTATDATKDGFLTLYPTGLLPPEPSSLNYAHGQTIANLVTVKPGPTGGVSFVIGNAAHPGVGQLDVVADLVGYYRAGTGDDRFNAMEPTRILDSRAGASNTGFLGPVQAGTPRSLTIRGTHGVPATAGAVVMNVTVTEGSANSFLSVFPGASPPNVSNINFAAFATVPNLVTVELDPSGAVSFANAIGNVNVVADLLGYFDPTSGDVFHPLDPRRVLDSRWSPENMGWLGGVTAGSPRTLDLGAGSVLVTGAHTILANTTVTESTRGSYLTVYPAGIPTPLASSLNFGAFETIPNLVSVRLSPAGSVAFATASGTVEVVADLEGYFAAT